MRELWRQRCQLSAVASFAIPGNRVAFRHEIRSQDRQQDDEGSRGAGSEARPEAAQAIAAREPIRARQGPKRSAAAAKRGYLDGQMLIAMPTMGDERFARSVIYVCAHSSEGAMGIIVNQPAPNISFPDLLVQLDVVGAPT